VVKYRYKHTTAFRTAHDSVYEINEKRIFRAPAIRPTLPDHREVYNVK